MNKSVKKVKLALEEAGLKTEIKFLNQSTKTAPLAASALGVSLGSIVKSLVLVFDKKPLIALVAGDCRLSRQKIKKKMKAKEVKLASAEEAKRITGYAIGGIPPLGYKKKIPTLIDKSLWRFQNVYAAAGSPQAVFSIKLKDLVRATNACPADIVEEKR